MSQAASAPADSIRLDAGASFTDGVTVKVSVGPASGGRTIDGVRLRNVVDGEPDDWTDVSALNDVSWSLHDGPDGQRSVDARVHYQGGDWSDVMSDSIVLDTTAPVASFEIINKFSASGDPWSAKGAGVDWPLLRVTLHDASFPLGGDIARIAIRVNDLPLRERNPDNSTRVRDGDSITYTDMYEGLFDDYEVPRGTITVKARWRDEAGNWSDVTTDSYEMVQYLNVATLWADGSVIPQPYADEPMGPAFAATNSATDMELRVRIDHLPVGPDGQTGTVDEIWVSGDYYGPWLKRSWGDGSTKTLTWSLTNTKYGYTSGDGIKKVYIKLRPSIGRDRSLGVSVILDRVTPTSDEPVTAVAIGSVVGSSGDTTAAAGESIKGSVVWDGADRKAKAKSGVGSFTLQRSANDGAWTTQRLAKRTARTATSSLASSNAYRFRVRTTDRAGNRSAWRSGQEVRPTIVSEASSKIQYSGNWKTRSQDDALGGRLRTTSTKGGSASLRFTGTGVAWVAPRSVDGDSVDVYIDGRKVKTAHLVASSYQPRRVVFSTAWSKRGTHTIKIVHRYSGHELPLDAFIVLR
ncbi:MAG: hypothetical protein U0667_08615 [Chloroflexota bacterium]